jgi:hypothetical protein
MKRLQYLSILAFFFLLLSCNKNNNSAGNATILARWILVSDSSYAGVAAANHLVIYNGVQGDYVYFNPDGQVYFYEKGMYTNLPYTLTSDSTITINSFIGGDTPEKCFVRDLTANTVLITTGYFYTPGGTFGRTISLRK